MQVAHVSLMHLLLFWAVVSCPGSGAVGTYPCIHAAEGERVFMSNFFAHELVQDMPVGLHGTFAVEDGGYIYLAGGGTQAAYSQSTSHYRFAL